MHYLSIKKEEWDRTLEQLLLSYTIFATVGSEFGLDYELLESKSIKHILYNTPKPATSLRNLFLPVKENVTSGIGHEKPRIILGTPNCDIEGLNLLDEMYLDKDFTDIYYRNRRENTILISSDCFGKQEHCHCLTYDIKPYSLKTADLAVISLNGTIIFRVINNKGEDFVKKIPGLQPLANEDILSAAKRDGNPAS
jgi:Tat protein secretion system quality control protein TatD with DNase activity